MPALALGAALSLPAQSQQVTLNFDDLGQCAQSPVNSYGGWISLPSGVNCQSGVFNTITAPYSPQNFLHSMSGMSWGASSTSWSFPNGPVTLNGFYTSGFGTYLLELLNGGASVYSLFFSTSPTPGYLGPPFGGPVDEVRITFYGGTPGLGVDDISFTPLNTFTPEDPGSDPGDGTSDPGDIVNQANAAPEPATLLLVTSGLGALGAARLRRRRSARNMG